jgi:hypothetical protein
MLQSSCEHGKEAVSTTEVESTTGNSEMKRNDSNHKRKSLTSITRVAPADISRQCQPQVRLDDDVINMAQQIMKQQRLVEGLQDTVLGPVGQFKVVRDGVQILHTGADHWVTVLTRSDNTVLLYDSLGQSMTQSLRLQIINLLGCTSGSITVLRENVQKQECNDCGVLAIAFAWALVSGRKPVKLSLDSTYLRSHLMSCLLNLKFSDFPSTNRNIERVTSSLEQINVP